MSSTKVITIVPKETWQPVRQFVAQPSCGICHPCAASEDKDLCLALPDCFTPMEGHTEPCKVFVEVKCAR